MVLNPAQATIYDDTHRFRHLRCGRKFGKTTLASEELGDCAFSANGKRVMYVAPTLEDSRRLMWDRLKERFRQAQAGTKTNDTRLELIIPTQDGGKSTIFLGSWEKVDNYRGDEFDFLIFDEVQDYRNFWTGWMEAMRPTLTPRMGQALFMGTPKGFNHFYDLANIELKDPDYKSFHFTTYDNPHIPVEEIEAAKRSMTGDRFSQEYLAEFVKTEGLVYKEFTRERNLYDELPVLWQKQWTKIAGIDFGYRNPAVVLDIRFNGEKLYVEDEWYKRERTDSQIADYVALQKFKEVFPDPENAGGVAELRQRGVNVREVLKGKDSVQNGIQKVREMLLRGDLMINKRCVNLISELEMYSYEDENLERNDKENPIKNHDHALDAMRYVVSSLLPLIERQDYIARMPVYHGPQKNQNPAR